jgi:hypothetical protein
MTNEPMTIKLNTGEVVTRPYREAVSLLSRRLADHVPEDEATVPLDIDPQTPVDSTDRTLEDLTKPELVELAKEHDLPVYGTKDDLIERLMSQTDDDQLSATTVDDDLDDLVGATPEDVPGEDSDDSDGGN